MNESALDIETLRKGLPEGPWRIHERAIEGDYLVLDGPSEVVAHTYSKSTARRIVRIPDMLTEIQRLRALNEEMRSVLQAFLDYGDARLHRDNARAAISKDEGRTE